MTTMKDRFYSTSISTMHNERSTSGTIWSRSGETKHSSDDDDDDDDDDDIEKQKQQQDEDDARTNVILGYCARQLTLHRACLVAIMSLEERLNTSHNVSQVVECNTQLLHLQAVCLDVEMSIKRVLFDYNSSSQDSQTLLFSIMDRDHDGALGLADLAQAFGKMDFGGAYCSTVWNAQKALDKFSLKSSTSGSARSANSGFFRSRNSGNNYALKTLSQQEFALFLEDLQEAMECDSSDTLHEMMLLWLCFNETGNDILDDALEFVDDSVAEDDGNGGEDGGGNRDFSDEIVEIRLGMLFQLLDWDGSGTVRFSDVVQLLWNIVEEKEQQEEEQQQQQQQKEEGGEEKIEKKAASKKAECGSDDNKRDAGDTVGEGEKKKKKKEKESGRKRRHDDIKRALFFSSSHRKELDYSQFTTLLLHVAAVTKLSFHALADRITVESAATMQMRDTEKKETKQDFMRQLFAAAATTKSTPLSVVNEDQQSSDDADADVDDDAADDDDGPKQNDDRLHILFSLWDQDGSGAIDVSEFVLGLRKLQQDDMDDAMEQTVMTMLEFDQDQNQELDEKEFGRALQKYATAMHISLDELIDFMVVESALRDNDKDDRIYLRKFKRQLHRQVKNQQQQQQQQQKRKKKNVPAFLASAAPKRWLNNLWKKKKK